MGKLINLVTPLHQATSRNYLARMLDQKIECMQTAKKYDFDYWDGDRRYGYGGYKYIPGRWRPVAQGLIDRYRLGPGSRVLDAGCGKGYLLYEMLLIEPELQLHGLDLSEYAIENAKPEIKEYLSRHDLSEPLFYKDNCFDLVLSLGCLHNLSLPWLANALGEIERVGRQSYVMVESYRSEEEFFNLQCWALTAQTLLDVQAWEWIFSRTGYTGDFEFIFFE